MAARWVSLAPESKPAASGGEQRANAEPERALGANPGSADTNGVPEDLFPGQNKAATVWAKVTGFLGYQPGTLCWPGTNLSRKH